MKGSLPASAVIAVIAAVVVSCAAPPRRVVFGIGLTVGAHAAVRLALEQINAGGGIGGVPLEVAGMESAERFDRFNPREVVEWADRFAADRDVLGVIGHSDSASTLTAAAVYNRSGVPQIVTVATNPAITNIGVWTYRLCLSDAAQGPALADYAVNVWKKRRVALFYVNDDYGRGLAQRFEKRLRALGAEVVRAVTHRNLLQNDDKATIEAALLEMKQGPAPELIVLFQRLDAAVWTVRAIREGGLQVDILGGDNLAQDPLSTASGGVTEGVRISQFYAPDAADARAAAFVRDYRAATGRDPDYSQAFAYDAVCLLRDAVIDGGHTRDGVKRYLDGLIAGSAVVRGVGGPYTLGPDHDARRPLYMAEVRNGRFTLLQPLPIR